MCSKSFLLILSLTAQTHCALLSFAVRQENLYLNIPMALVSHLKLSASSTAIPDLQILASLTDCFKNCVPKSICLPEHLHIYKRGLILYVIYSKTIHKNLKYNFFENTLAENKEHQCLYCQYCSETALYIITQCWQTWQHPS